MEIDNLYMEGTMTRAFTGFNRYKYNVDTMSELKGTVGNRNISGQH